METSSSGFGGIQTMVVSPAWPFFGMPHHNKK